MSVCNIGSGMALYFGVGILKMFNVDEWFVCHPGHGKALANGRSTFFPQCIRIGVGTWDHLDLKKRALPVARRWPHLV